MAVWGWVGSDTSEASIRQTAIHAVTTTLKMRAALRDLNADWLAAGTPAFANRSGHPSGTRHRGRPRLRNSERLHRHWRQRQHRLPTRRRDQGIRRGQHHQRHHPRPGRRPLPLPQHRPRPPQRQSHPLPIFTVLHEIEQAPPPGLDNFEQAMLHYRSGRFPKPSPSSTKPPPPASTTTSPSSTSPAAKP